MLNSNDKEKILADLASVTEDTPPVEVLTALGYLQFFEGDEVAQVELDKVANTIRPDILAITALEPLRQLHADLMAALVKSSVDAYSAVHAAGSEEARIQDTLAAQEASDLFHRVLQLWVATIFQGSVLQGVGRALQGGSHTIPEEKKKPLESLMNSFLRQSHELVGQVLAVDKAMAQNPVIVRNLTSSENIALAKNWKANLYVPDIEVRPQLVLALAELEPAA